jgi:hypothetical protein
MYCVFFGVSAEVVFLLRTLHSGSQIQYENECYFFNNTSCPVTNV